MDNYSITNDNQPMFSMEAEHGVLGAMLIRPELIATLSEDLSHKDFYSADHQVIYQKIISLHSAGRTVDIITASDGLILPSDDVAFAYVAEIANNTPSVANAFAYAKIVSERAVSRRLLSAGVEIQDIARSSSELQDRIAEAGAVMASIEAPDDGSDAVLIQDLVLQQVDEWEARRERFESGQKLAGMSTGLKDLDSRLGGLRPGQLIIIGGRPGMGKTTLAMGFALDAVLKQEKSALVFSLEMSHGQLVDRLIASIAGVNLQKIQSGEVWADYDDSNAISGAASRLRGAKLAIIDKGNLTISGIRSTARKFKYKHTLDLVVIDYLQLMSGNGGSNRNEEISIISRGAKLLARELNVPVVLLSQLNRESTKRPGAKPQVSDLRDSGSIEQDADVVVLVHRPQDPEDPEYGSSELIVGKNRDGEAGTAMAAFVGKHNKFADLAPEALQKIFEGREEKSSRSVRPISTLSSRYAK